MAPAHVSDARVQAVNQLQRADHTHFVVDAFRNPETKSDEKECRYEHYSIGDTNQPGLLGGGLLMIMCHTCDVRGRTTRAESDYTCFAASYSREVEKQEQHTTRRKLVRSRCQNKKIKNGSCCCCRFWCRAVCFRCCKLTPAATSRAAACCGGMAGAALRNAATVARMPSLLVRCVLYFFWRFFFPFPFFFGVVGAHPHFSPQFFR